MGFHPGGRRDNGDTNDVISSAVQADAVTFPRLPCLEVLLASSNITEARDATILRYTRELAKARNITLPTNASKFVHLFESTQTQSGPCGYVFQRGDIAWNCRTCQHDATCVICDDCFQASDHTNHEVFFHRTTPGGCCDCGDLEAWDTAGCCDKHRPAQQETPKADDDMEMLLENSRNAAERSWDGISDLLPPIVKVVVRSCLFLVCNTVQRSAEAADADFSTAGSLRLHNDDVHTFEEVIDALQQLSCDKPNELTQKVDSEGQVVAKKFDTKEATFAAFEKFKSHGLLCAIATPELEQQESDARGICNYLTELANAHTAIANAIVEALVADLNPRTVPKWDVNGILNVQDESSYLTELEQYRLFDAALQLAGDRFLSDVGVDATFYETPVMQLYPKSPHALWGTLPGNYAELIYQHPLLDRYRNVASTGVVSLSNPIYVIDTDLRKQQEGDLLAAAVYPYALPGLHKFDHQRCMEWRHLLAAASFRAPLSPLLWLLLLDPYPPKQLRGSIHALFLSVLNVGYFKAKFAGALAVAYRPLSTLYCAGIGTDADTPLHFTVQIFTAGSLVRALEDGPSVEALLKMGNDPVGEIGIFVPPISHCIARCVHTNLLGATKEVNMLLNNSTNTQDLIYVAGEHPVFTLLPAAPDDGFLDARSTRHKRLQYVLRDLEYVLETSHFVWDDVFAGVWCRMTRLSQGMDPQRRRISGGHVEYETTRWLEAFGLSLTMIQTVCTSVPALLREIKLWLYREGILQTGLLDSDTVKMDALQRSTLHCGNIGLACATSVKMSESQLSLFENVTVDWLRVPHSPMGGDALSFHLPLHRALAKCIFHSLTEDRIPILDDFENPENSLSSILKPTIRPQNCRVVWSTGPDCSTQEAQRRRSRSRHIGGLIAGAKVIHSLADHPIRCLAASLQVERHLWARNGSSVAGMAVNYSSAPLCRSFRDLDLLLVQFSASGMSCGMGVRRVFDLLLSRFGVDEYLVDPERKPNGSWVNPPRLQDPDHAAILAECFMQLVCILVTELPAQPSNSVERGIRRELVHALAAEPRTHSEAISAASHSVTRKNENEGVFRETFSRVLKEVGKPKGATSRTGPPVFELKPAYCDEYDPTFFHLRRNEHQHAMDVISRMRKQKLGANFEFYSLPLVCPPPKAHVRFLPCRLMLHLDTMDACLRRSLLFALTNGLWLPPSEPESEDPDIPLDMDVSTSSGDVPTTVFKVRSRSHGKRPGAHSATPDFSQDVVASSSISFSEVLQLLTLQAHTLEECASIHRSLPHLDDEGRSLSANLSIHSYLERLVFVPDSLQACWALQPYPTGPLMSSGSGLHRGSILGLLVALYEHRADHGVPKEDNTKNDEDHVGAKSLVSSGLKWLLRFISSIIEGAPTVSAAYQAATTGVPMDSSKKASAAWMIGPELQSIIRGMLHNLPDLWPKTREIAASPSKSTAKGKEAMKRKQEQVMAMMRQKQELFAQTIPFHDDKADENDENETCIICRCDDADGENNGPLGYLGHVQRSRAVQLRYCKEISDSDILSRTFRVVGHMGCMVSMRCHIVHTTNTESRKSSGKPTRWTRNLYAA